jgi:hypothetical protein
LCEQAPAFDELKAKLPQLVQPHTGGQFVKVHAQFRYSAVIALFALGLAGLSPARAQEVADTEQRNAGPKNLVITYRCTAANRPRLRSYMLKQGVQRFEKWKQDGTLANYRILFNRYNDTETYDMMAILNFGKYSEVDKWAAIEAESPGGLTEEALSFITPLNTYSMDVIWHGSTASVKAPPARTVFFLIPYDYYPHTMDEYIKYANGYVIPQINGWVSKGVLANYAIYLNRYPTSRPWKVLFALEYKDGESFGARERTIAEVRAALKSDPNWKALSDTKLNMRIEKETVVADELLPGK